MRPRDIVRVVLIGALMAPCAGVRGEELPAAGREAMPDDPPLADRKEEAGRLVERIRATRHPHIGADAILKLRRLGRPGLAAWLDLFPVRQIPSGGIELSPGKAPGILTVGEVFEVEVTLTNRTKGPLWVSTYEPWMPVGKRAGAAPRQDKARRAARHPEERFLKTMFAWPYPEGVDDALIMLSDLYDLVLLAPGESVTCRIGCMAPESPGRYDLWLTYGATAWETGPVERLKAQARDLLAAPAPVTFKQNDQIIRGFPDIASCETNCDVIEVKEKIDETH